MSGTNEQFEWESETSSETGTTETLSTGMEVLDRKFGGGIPAGKVIALSAAPASQSELFLYEMATIRETTYLTSERSATAVEDALDRAGAPVDEIEIHRLTTGDPLGDAWPVIDDVADESTLIVDPIGPLESTAESDYRAFMNDLKDRTVETGSLTLLHCLDGRDVPPQRDRTEYLADVIFDLVTELRGSSIENSLSVPKFRGGRSLTETIALDLTTDVTIDVSRKIA